MPRSYPDRLFHIIQLVLSRWLSTGPWQDVADLDLQGRTTRRRRRPLALFHWDSVRTLAASCETRQDFRKFRVDIVRA